MMAAVVDVRSCLDIFAGWPRRYVYWKEKTWLTGPSLAERVDIERLIRERSPVGVWQCYGESVERDCTMRDVVVFELDGGGCDSLRCLLNMYGPALRRASRLLAPYKPLVWYNGGKSIYYIILIEPAPADYSLKPEWRGMVKLLGMDSSMITPRHSFRLPCTPHQKTKRYGVWLDPTTLKPIDAPALPPSRINSYAFLEPPLPPKPARWAIKQQAKPNGGFNVLEAVRELVESSPKLRTDCRKRLAAFIGGMCAALNKAWEECLDYMHSLPIDWAREHERYAKYYYEGAKAGRSKFSFRNLVEGDVWYSVKECL